MKSNENRNLSQTFDLDFIVTIKSLTKAANS